MSAEPAAVRADLLAPDGALAASIPHYEDRPEQRQMAATVARVLEQEGALVVEAGTGTGKTLAYLVPALQSGKRVVISTGTRTLQEQIWRQDIPLLRELIRRPFTAAILKGVSNYVCRRRLGEMVGRGVAEADRDDFAAIADWAASTESGDRAEIETVGDGSPLWARLTTTPETRLGGRCPMYERCFVTRARRAAEEAELILVNHHLLFADAALRAAYPGARVLPDYDALVLDEAHQLEDVVTEHFGVSVSTVRLGQLCRDARGALRLGDGPLLVGGAGERIVAALEQRAADFFIRAGEALRGATGRVELPERLLQEGERQDAWFRLDAALDDLGGHARAEADDADDERGEALAAIARRTRAVRDDLATLAERGGDRFVYWGELRGGAVFLRASPIEVGDLVREHILDRIPATVFTSATLTVAGTFTFFRHRLGLGQTPTPTLPLRGRVGAEAVEAGVELQEAMLPSPFDYSRQAMLYLPADLPEPRESGFAAACAERVAELLAITEGRAFVLFTSHRMLSAVARRLTGRVPYPLLVQGREPRASLIERFRAGGGAVLLATGAFWEGVDVPGDALSLVIIDKLPFAPPTDPLIAARMRLIEARGGDPFTDYQLPSAALSLKQGFGRLIRRRDDRGIVAILDRRVTSRRYGRVLLDSLPPAIRRTAAIEQVRRWWTTPMSEPAGGEP